jgi:anti-sigma factor (TIGR02949 family)
MTIENEKVIAGLSCSDVLARLSDYVDGELPADERARVEEHLRGCDGCARFGGAFGATVRALREHLSTPRDLPDELRDRIRRALDEDAGRR